MKHEFRIALVTGAANGIGRAIAQGLLIAGYSVAAVDRDAQALKDLQTWAARHTPSARLGIFEADLTRLNATDLTAQVVQSLGQIDILINNAGIGQAQVRPDYHRNPPPFFEVSEEQWHRAVAVNGSAVFLLSRAVICSMMERGWGRIVNITTSLGAMLRYGNAPYGPSKACAEALSAVMAADLEGTGVTTNVLIPGGITNTSMIPEQAPFDRDDLIQTEVMLPPLLWLVSPDSNGTNGQRFLAIDWDTDVNGNMAAAKAAKPIGWPGLGVLPVTPAFQS